MYFRFRSRLWLICYQSSEAAVIQLFTEVRRHKPSVVYIPDVSTWYKTVGEATISTFLGLLRALAPTEPILLLGVLECEPQYIDPQMLRDLFGFSRKNLFDIRRPDRVSDVQFPWTLHNHDTHVYSKCVMNFSRP